MRRTMAYGFLTSVASRQSRLWQNENSFKELSVDTRAKQIKDSEHRSAASISQRESF